MFFSLEVNVVNEGGKNMNILEPYPKKRIRKKMSKTRTVYKKLI